MLYQRVLRLGQAIKEDKIMIQADCREVTTFNRSTIISLDVFVWSFSFHCVALLLWALVVIIW